MNVEEARPGMVLAAPVAHPDKPQHDLLLKGYALEPAAIERLRDMGVPSLYVDYPGLEDLDKHLAPQLSPARQAMYREIRDTMIQVQGRTGAGVPFVDYYATTRELVLTLVSQGAHPVYMERVSGLGCDAVAHATTVAHLAMVMGLRMGDYLIQQRPRLAPHHAREVVNLGVAGMLHDVGKMKLPEEVRSRCELDANPNENADVRAQWENHPRLSYDIIRHGVESSASAAVLHHHQHFDGSGFPGTGDAAHAGCSIHVFARTLLAADLYANLARPAGTNIRRGNLEVLHLMRTRYARWIDPVVFRTLQAVAPPFLPGSKVVLGDRTTAAIVKIRPADPYVPVVRRFKPDGAELDGPCLDLREHGAPRLVALAGGPPIARFMPDYAAAVCAA